MSAALRPAPLEASAPASLLPLLREVGDLKRIRSAGREGSIAARLFRRAWCGLVAGRGAAEVAYAVTAAALAAARLGDLDAERLRALGLPPNEALAILRRSLDEVGRDLDSALRATLAAALADEPVADGPLPPFVAALADQPRAGVTCPGRARIVLQPPESHAEHCAIVAVYGVALAPTYGADPATVFLAALAHHLHNAAMPDSGFTGETLLEPHLAPVMARATAAALAELSPELRARVVEAREVLPDDATPEGRTFHAADVIDRVLEIEQHLAAARLTMADVLGPMALVHEGPVKAFHDRVLREVGLP